jgi:hypothetical protein
MVRIAKTRETTAMTRLSFALALAIALTGMFASFGSASAKPHGVTAGQCILDDGYNRYRPCSGADGS